VALGSLVCWLVTLHIAGGLKRDDRYGPFQPRPFYDSMNCALSLLILMIFLEKLFVNKNHDFLLTFRKAGIEKYVFRPFSAPYSSFSVVYSLFFCITRQWHYH